MSGKQQRLAAALQNFTAELDGLTPPVDYHLAATVQVGVNGSRQPQGMEAMKLALQQRGFLRDGAKIVVAFFTDSEDCSDPAHRVAMLSKDPATGNIVDQCAIMARGGAPSGL